MNPRAAIFLCAALFACAGPGGRLGGGERGRVLADLDARVAGLVPVEGFVRLYWERSAGRILLEVPPEEELLLYVVSLPHGLGSNDVGLDRGQIGPRHAVRFARVGERVLLLAPNLAWRAEGAARAEREGVKSSFAESVLFGFEIEALRTEEDGTETLLVDATELFLRDAHGIRRRLEDAGQGAFELDRTRSAISASDLRGFPRNTEVEVLLTFAGERPGEEVEATAPDPRAVSLRVRHSFVRLPPLDRDLGEAGDPAAFRPRRFDPRSGYFPLRFHDLSRPIDLPTERAWIHRHRLDASHPIVYHVDRAAPEPVRTALVEGARYWVPVFEAAGYPGGFRVELLPEGADPLDVRFNVIQWVSRSTRGWSYGDAVADPRTGEILKGHVTLGALRVRRDVLLFEGLLSPYEAGEGPDWLGGASDPRVIEAALARIRQLAAHEVGHTLGLAHNFAASPAGRASVMDYPPPRVRITDEGGLDLGEAYAQGCGEWDELAILYGYGDFGSGPAEERALAELLAAMEESGIPYLSDHDARGSDRGHPHANLWDDGADPVAELRHAYDVRSIALERFSEAALRPGRPLADLELVFLPLFLHHRFQLEAAVRQVAGLDYDHEIRSDATPAGTRPVPASLQREALEVVLESLDPSFLAVPERIAGLLVPPVPGSRRGRESLQPGGLFFDPLAASSACARLTIELLLDPARAERLVDQSAGTELPSLEEVLAALEARLDPVSVAGDPRMILHAIRPILLGRLMRLARDPSVPVRVQAPALSRLRTLREAAAGNAARDPFAAWELDLLERFFEHPELAPPAAEGSRIPPGAPIGSADGCAWYP